MSRGARKPVITDAVFDRDYSRCFVRGENVAKLDLIVDLLSRGKKPPKSFDPHPVTKDFSGMLEGHIGPDFLLVFRPEQRKLHLHRCGNHAELFPRSKSARRRSPSFN